MKANEILEMAAEERKKLGLASPKKTSDLLGGRLFDGLEVAFAADIEPQRYDFKIGDLDCYITLRRMNGAANSRYQMAGFKIGTTGGGEGGGDLEAGIREFDMAERELALMNETVIDFQLPRKRRLSEGEWHWELTQPGAQMTAREKAETLSGLEATLYKRLVKACQEINELESGGFARGE